jgi:hypothetical protein
MATPPPCHGVLGLKDKRYAVKVTPLDGDCSNPKSLLCLEDYLLSNQQPNFSRQKRMDLALGLSLAILQFFSTPWIDMWWTWRDFCILKDDMSQIFVTKKFYSTQNLNPKVQTPIHSPQISMFWECIGEPILTRLGFALVELALGNRLSDLREQNSGLDANPDMLDLITARQLVSEGRVLREADRRYNDAAKACLMHEISTPNGARRLNSKHPDFQADLETFVVAPIREGYASSWGTVRKLQF